MKIGTIEQTVNELKWLKDENFNLRRKLRSIKEDNLKDMAPNEKSNVYTITIESRFILTQSQIKQALGLGYKILSVETEKDIPNDKIINVDTAAIEIIKTGYRALARAFHPDLGGDESIMRILNQTKTELVELIRSLK